jgi:hypothetical protein
MCELGHPIEATPNNVRVSRIGLAADVVALPAVRRRQSSDLPLSTHQNNGSVDRLSTRRVSEVLGRFFCRVRNSDVCA